MIRIYGASDDLVEIEGHPKGDEVGCYNQRVVVVIGDEATGGVAVRMSYGTKEFPRSVGFACWSAEVVQLSEECPIPWPVTITTQDYSACVNIDAPGTVPLTFEVQS